MKINVKSYVNEPISYIYNYFLDSGFYFLNSLTKVVKILIYYHTYFSSLWENEHKDLRKLLQLKPIEKFENSVISVLPYFWAVLYTDLTITKSIEDYKIINSFKNSP